MYNLVNWVVWSEGVFEKVKVENKLVFVFIGYLVCYWCYVMEYELFEDEEVVMLMNWYFVCIKVDCEEWFGID